ncbi:glycosyltransferase family 4 protein [Psychromonas sp. PT13]|uniref:glycosyltransferase family 4 protein n=1 Tax=Psychromonas sp. PT13 TaxID=3439547 RepID=UPI003EBC4D8D
MKKVLFVFHDSNPLSGATASMLEVVIALKRMGKYEIIAFIPNTKRGLDKVLDSHGIKFIEALIYGVRHKATGKNILVEKLKSIAGVVLNLTQAIKLVLKGYKFDLIYTNTSDVYIGAFLSKLMVAKHVWHIREFGVEDQNMSHLFGEANFYKFVSSSTNKVVVISNALKDKLINFNVPQNKIDMIYNDVANKDSTNEKFFNTEKILSLLMVGTISNEKGHEFIVDCIAYMKSINLNVKLSIVGDEKTNYVTYLKEYIKRINCEDRIEFLGYSSDVLSIRKKHDIAVVASKSEAFGRVTIEAMHSKMTVVASDSGANPELIVDGKSGFLFDVGNVKEFSKIISVIEGNRILLKSIGMSAYISAEKFSNGQAANKINKVICCTLGES